MTKRPDVVDMAIAAAKAGSYLIYLSAMPDWSKGLCLGQDPDIWFSEEVGVQVFAREICSMCPVAELCLQVALADPSIEGIWANTDQEERKAMAGNASFAIDADCFEEGIHILSGTASTLAAFYGVTVRTVVRWKEALRSQAIFASYLGLAA